MWNILNLKCPTEDLCQYNILESTILQELPTLVSLLTTSAEVLTQDNPIWTEISVFQNVQEKYTRILQCDKCLRLLQRVGICLRKMVLLNLSKIYLDLAEQFLGGLQSQCSTIRLPSSQQLEYILLRTQSAAKLICEALHYSRETFCYLIQRLRMGHLILNLMMATSVAARVNLVFKDLLIQVFDIYKKLYIWLKKLKKGTTEWPKPLDLPEDLEAWLSPEASDLLKAQHVPKGQVAFLSNLLQKQKNGTKKIQTDNISDDECLIIEQTSQLHLQDSDVGEVIPRPKKHKEKKKRRLTESQTLLLEKIQNAESLKKLKIIWNHLDVGSPALLGEVLKPCKIRTIEKIFLTSKRKLKKIKQSAVPVDVKEQQKVSLRQSTGKKLAKNLGLIETVSEPSMNSVSTSVLPVEKLKPVRKLKDLRLLFNTLYKRLQSTQDYEKCAELEKQFKDRRVEIKRLFQNDKKKLAKILIAITSTEFLNRFKN